MSDDQKPKLEDLSAVPEELSQGEAEQVEGGVLFQSTRSFDLQVTRLNPYSIGTGSFTEGNSQPPDIG
jgi:hypothetical protein